MTESTQYYEGEECDLLYANNAILNLANVSASLKHENLDELLRKDEIEVKKQDEAVAWYHGKISRESAESLLREGWWLSVFYKKNSVSLSHECHTTLNKIQY